MIFKGVRILRHSNTSEFLMEVLQVCGFVFYIGAREEARDLALALARACSLTSARS